jgi:hypothetical protein
MNSYGTVKQTEKAGDKKIGNMKMMHMFLMMTVVMVMMQLLAVIVIRRKPYLTRIILHM